MPLGSSGRQIPIPGLASRRNLQNAISQPMNRVLGGEKSAC